MTNKQCYDSKKAVFDAMPDEQAKSPTMPVDKFLQEAENTFNWCQKDKEKIVGAGLDWAIVEDVPVRAGALREAESNWFTSRLSREEAQKIWNRQSPEGYALRDDIIHAMLHAYRKEPDILARVRAIAEGSGNADMIQDDNDIAVLGKQHPEQLRAIKFDMTLLDRAAELSGTLAGLLAAASTDREEYTEVKLIRDKAFAHLKEAVDEIRACGQYVFWKDAERFKGYVSAYNRQRKTKKTEKTPSEQ